jgi:alkanesulfonate monooxygenase
VQAARQIGAIPVEYPKPPADYAGKPVNGTAAGMRIGIISRSEDAEAWAEAYARFPEDRKGQLTHQLAMQVSDSHWHRQLSELGDAERPGADTYWLTPFKNYKALCPYLVGSYDRVADEVARYIEAGYRTFILEAPVSAEEMWHIGVVFERALARCSISAAA